MAAHAARTKLVHTNLVLTAVAVVTATTRRQIGTQSPRSFQCGIRVTIAGDSPGRYNCGSRSRVILPSHTASFSIR